jgi:hypothetical protein
MEVSMTDAVKPKLEVVPSDEDLDEDEIEFRKLRRDLPGVRGASAAGIVTIAVSRKPGKNEYFRTHPEFKTVFALVDHEVGMEKHYFAVAPEMIQPLAGIGITVTDHVLYLTTTSEGAVRIVPIALPDAEGNQNEYSRTKEIALLRGMKEWVRMYTDRANQAYRSYPAPAGRFDDPIWPELSHAKILRLAFRDKGRLIDGVEHPLFLKWAGRDTD